MTHTILVVDDEIALAEVLANTLEYQGYTVYTAEDGLAALDVIQQNKIDLVICDYMMPRLNGIALYHRLTIDHTAPRIPIIMMSALPDALKELTVYATLTKPFQFDELIDNVKGALADPAYD